MNPNGTAHGKGIGVPRIGPGAGRVVDALIRELLAAHVKRRGWSRVSRGSGIPGSTLESVIKGRKVAPATEQKALAYAAEQERLANGG